MREQIILGADEKGKFTGEYFPNSVGHTGEGKPHLAITVQIYNSKGELLLQKRKHKIFNNIFVDTSYIINFFSIISWTYFNFI